MRRFRVYVDTSVIGGCFDPEFAAWSRLLVEDFRRRRLRPVVSDVVSMEVDLAPPNVRSQYNELGGLEAEILVVTRQVDDLAVAYAEQGVLSWRSRNDMLHVALASFARVDALVSWDFRHLVRVDKVRAFNAVNARLGVPPVTIASPREVTFYGET